MSQRLDQVVADAKVVITELGMSSINTAGSNLKVAGHLAELAKHLETLERFRGMSAWQRLKDAMFDTRDDVVRSEAVRHVVNLTYQLNRCLRCRCITCPIIDDNCRCAACLYGSHVTTCEGGEGVETRNVEKGVYMVSGQPVILAEHHRGKVETTVTVVDRNGVERKLLFDAASGTVRPARQ